MSMEIHGKVGAWELKWKSIPRGPEGTAQVELKDGKLLDVSWRRDKDGLWITLPYGTFGFDLEGETGDDGRVAYRVSRRGSFEEWAGVSFLRSGEEETTSAAGAGRKSAKVKAQMPGKIIRIQVKVGDAVERNQPLVVMEAMKMENEIKAPQSGRVDSIKVSEGQAVETGAELLTLQALD
jgi:biotin carboxyl carrier protein